MKFFKKLHPLRDHASGTKELVQHFNQARIYGGDPVRSIFSLNTEYIRIGVIFVAFSHFI